MGIPIEDFFWFDEKYKGQIKSSLEDRTELFRQVFKSMNIKLSDRNKEQIKEALKDSLFKLRMDFKPSLYTLAYELLFCYAPLLGISREEYDKYLSEFREAISGYKGNPCVSCPFEE